MTTKATGDRGERLAETYLEGLGYRILERNYRFRHAEIDLVCFEPAPKYEDGGEIVFVEVKTRLGRGFGRPEEAVTEAKQRQIVLAADAYLHERRLELSLCRFDVVAVTLQEGRPEIEHFRHAFRVF